MLHKDLTDEIIYWYYQVYNGLGYGFLEKVYKNYILNCLELGCSVTWKSRYRFITKVGW